MQLYQIIILVVVIILVLIIIFTGYVKASPDTAFIISGLRKRPKILIGKAGIKIPFLEKKDQLSLQLISVKVETSEPVPTLDYINVNVTATISIKISDDPAKLALAAQNFLNKDVDYIARIAKEVLTGNVREIVGTMHLEDMVTDRKAFAEGVKQAAEPDLSAMGLDIISFNIQDFMDQNHVIENLGVDNVVRIQKNAAISRAESERDIQMAQARAQKEANDAQVVADTAIAERQNELAIKQAELKKISDIKKAEADAAYNIQEQEQRKSIEVANTNADIAKQERIVELKRQEVEVTEKALEANIKKKAEAEKFARQQAADAELYERQKKAEAEAYEKKQQAEAMLIQNQKEAEGIRAVGLAEAEAIKAKGIAEAEATEKKAEAMKKYGDAAKLEMIIAALPEMAKAVAEPLNSIDKVTIIDGGGNSDTGVGSMGGYVPSMMAKTIETVKATTGFDMTEVMKANTYDAKINRNLNVSGITELASENKSEE